MRPQEEEEMRVADEREVDRWIQEHNGELILCPHQPGLLMISKKACLKRHRAALAQVFEGISQEDPFYFALKKGLTLCGSCPIGKRLVEENEKDASGKRKGQARA